MNVLAGPFLVAAALLAVGGALKALRPGDTARALRLSGLPGTPPLVRAGAVAELVIGTGALVFGSRAFAALVAASYLAFAAFVVRALARDVPISSCGCFGKAETPPSTVHVAVDGLAAVAAVGVALDPGVGIGDVLADQPLAGVPFLLLGALALFLVFTALTELPRTLAAMREIVS